MATLTAPTTPASVASDDTTTVPAPLSASTSTISRADLLFAVLLAGASSLVMFDAWRDIWRLGTHSEELSYVLLAPIVIAWIAWSRAARIRECRPRGQWLGLLILLAGYGVYWYGFLADPVLWRAGAVMACVGAVVAALGTEVLRKFLPAFAASLFLVPISPTGRYNIAEPLQRATATATQTVCDLLGIYVDRTGNLLTINDVDVTVAEACNGMRMVLTLFLVCYLVAFTVPLRRWVRVLLLAVSPLVAIVSNVVRLVPTVWLFGHSSPETANRFHDVSGWGMTVLSFLLLMGGCTLLQRATTDDDKKPAEKPAPASA